MLIATAERTDLLHLGARDWKTQRVDVLPVPTKEGCVLVWRNAVPGQMPDVVVVSDGGVQSFLAWTTTYLPHLTPITALTQVAEHGACDNGGSLLPESSDASLGDAKFARGCLGMLHAEVVAGYRGEFAPLYAGVTPHLSTLSWLAIQTQTATRKRSPLLKLRQTWDEARRLLDAPRLGYASDDVEEVWSLITDPEVGGGAAVNRQVSQISAFLDSVRSEAPEPGVLDIAKKHVDEVNALEAGPLEGRVEVFRTLLQSLYAKRGPPGGHAVLAGFALSQISQGSFSHIGLLRPDRVSDVRPLLWYGWFDFSRQQPEPASPAVASASLQLLQRLRGPCSRSAQRDIAIDELRVLSRQKEPFADCLLDRRHPITVEIAPGAVSVIQPGRGRTPDAGRARNAQVSLFDDPE